MSVAKPLRMNPEDKLDILRYLDPRHPWESLDDERRCHRCGRVINGRQIGVIELQGMRGKLHLQCPTAGCVSTPDDWSDSTPIRAVNVASDSRA